MIPYRHPDGGPRIRRQDQLLFESSRVRVGLFEARPEDPHFQFSAVPDEYLLVFPCTSARIEHQGKRGFIADRSVVTYYNPGQVYRRGEVSSRGDRAHWFSLSPSFLSELLAELGCARGKGDSLFRFTRGPSDAASYRLQSQIVRSLVYGDPSPGAVETAVRSIARRVIPAAEHRARRTPRQRGSDLVERARELLATRYREALTIDALARELDCSPSHLGHSFRQETGTSPHAYRDQLRLRRALLELHENRGNLTDLGLELGYSSHSHFTERFRRAFGAAPTRVLDRSR